MHTLIWFHRDLRIHDHSGLEWALKNSSKISAVVFPPERSSEAKFNFWKKSVEELQLNLNQAGIHLQHVSKRVQFALPEITSDLKADVVITHQRMNFREKNELSQITKNLSVEFKELGELTLYPSDKAAGLSLKDLTPFTKFKKFAQANWEIPQEIVSPLEENSSALKRLQHYLWGTNAVDYYHETRNGMINVDDSSKFSPWLSWGALSPRRIYWELKKYEEVRGKNQGIDALVYELIWRDYFKYLAFIQGESFFKRDGLKSSPFIFKEDPDLFSSWTLGETGEQFVDANMRELLLTGWMSNRGRQNVASYLAKTLQLDWTLGAQWFEEQLIDEDPENNFGNWQYLAGVGTDPRDRIFDVRRQASIYDPNGDYQSRWRR